MIIDCHGHVSPPPTLWVYKANLLSHRGAHGRRMPEITDEEILASANKKEMAPKGHLDMMDAFGIDLQMLSPRPFQMMHSAKPAKLVRVGDVLIEEPPIAWPLWGLVPAFALSAWAVCIGTFCIAVGVWGRIQVQAWPRWLFWVSLLAGLPITAIALLGGVSWLLMAWYALIGLAFLIVGTLFGAQAFRRGSDWTHRLVALAMVINAVAGLRDLLVFYISPAYGEYTYLRYTSLLFGVSLALFVVNRFS